MEQKHKTYLTCDHYSTRQCGCFSGAVYRNTVASNSGNCSFEHTCVSYCWMKEHVQHCNHLNFLTNDGKKSVGFNINLLYSNKIFPC